MKVWKKLLPLVVIGLILTGCGSQSSQKKSSQSSQTTSSQTTSSTSSNDQDSSKASMKPSAKKSTAKKTSAAVAKKAAKGEPGFSTQQFANAAEAKHQIRYESNMGGQPVKLGYGIKGTQDAGAGQVYVHFNMGHWSINVHGNNVSTKGKNQTIPTAKKTVKYLQKHTLPYPNKYGSILLQADRGQGASILKWQNRNKVNTVSADSAAAALKKATSLPK